MSLDVYLYVKRQDNIACSSASKIFTREDGSTKEISREEWNLRFPNREPVIVEYPSDNESEEICVYSANITHNLTKMADLAGIYKYLWRPDEINITIAKELIQPLTEGVCLLKTDPDKFKKLNPENGWGSYEGLVSFVEKYLAACIQHPEASIHISR